MHIRHDSDQKKTETQHQNTAVIINKVSLFFTADILQFTLCCDLDL